MMSMRSVARSIPLTANLDINKLAAIQTFTESLQEPTAADASSSYAPQSATVQGILKDMYDTFTADIEKLTQTEASLQRDYEDLIAELTKELNTMNGIVAKKEEEKAAAAQELADTVQELDDTQAQLD